MDVQWIIIAQEYRLNRNRTIDIRGIFHHITIHDVNDRPSLFLIAKMNVKPTEVGENKKLMLKITHDRERKSISYHLQSYSIPDWDTWANSIPYIAIELDEIELPYSGEYTFSLLVDGEHKNEETIGVTYV